jgi:hypothetical protein
MAIVMPPSLPAYTHSANHPGWGEPPHGDGPEADAGGLAVELVEVVREDAVAVMEEEPALMVRWYRFAELLCGPLGRGMHGHMAMQNPTRGVLHQHEDIKEKKVRRDHRAEIAGDDGFGWLRANVTQRWDGMPRFGARSKRLGKYFRTVRGDTCKPRLRRSSLAMRSSPHVGLSRAIRRMSACRSAGIGGRSGLDVHRQNHRNP